MSDAPGVTVALAALGAGGGLAAGLAARRCFAGLALERGIVPTGPTPPWGAVTATTVLVGGVVAIVGEPLSLLPARLLLGWALVVAAAIDLPLRIIPDRLTFPVAAAALVLVAVGSAIERDVAILARGLAWGTGLPLGLLATSVLFRALRGQAGVGLGDVKLAVPIGLVLGALGSLHVVVFVYATFLGAAAVVLVAVAMRRLTLVARVPFGPALALGGVVALIGGQPAATWMGRVLLGA